MQRLQGPKTSGFVRSDARYLLDPSTTWTSTASVCGWAAPAHWALVDRADEMLPADRSAWKGPHFAVTSLIPKVRALSASAKRMTPITTTQTSRSVG